LFAASGQIPGYNRSEYNRQGAKFRGYGQGNADAGNHRRAHRFAVVQQNGAVQGQQSKGGGNGVDGEEVGQLNLQHRKCRKGRRQQAAPGAVQPPAQQKNQVHRQQVGQAHQKAPNNGIAVAGGAGC